MKNWSWCAAGNYTTESRNPVRFDERYPYHVFDYNLPARSSTELLINRSTSGLDERSEYPTYQLEGEHATFYHPYYRPERYFNIIWILLWSTKYMRKIYVLYIRFFVRRDRSVSDSFHQRYPNSFSAPATYRKNLVGLIFCTLIRFLCEI